MDHVQTVSGPYKTSAACLTETSLSSNMFSFRMLLVAVVLTLLVLPVESGDSSGSGRAIGSVISCKNNNPECQLKGSAVHDSLSIDQLRTLLEAPVVTAEKVERPLNFFPFRYLPPMGPISHSGVRVTLEDDSKWLIHKGPDHGAASQTVVTNADNMSTRWREAGVSTDFNGGKTVSDLIRAGGETYHVRNSNCHDATDAMLNANQ